MITNIREARACLKATRLSSFKRNILKEVAMGGMDMRTYRLRETLGVDTFDAITLDASHNSLIAGYGSVPADWRNFCRIGPPTPDFKQVNASALGGLSNLDIVRENQDYQNKTQLDERVSYTPQKRGNLLVISLEAQAGDSLGALNQESEHLGNAAANTINEFVIGTNFDDNPTCDYDSVALFAAGHSNLDTSRSLTLDNVELGIASMMTQTGRGGEQIYIRPSRLVVAPENALTAKRLLQSTLLITGNTTTQGDKNPIPGILDMEPIVSPHINVDASDWYLLDPSHPPIELRFVGGMETPDILREPENTGSSFRSDSIAFKVRHAYGGDVIDHRGAYHAEE